VSGDCPCFCPAPDSLLLCNPADVLRKRELPTEMREVAAAAHRPPQHMLQ
jgi:hypothetical protein